MREKKWVHCHYCFQSNSVWFLAFETEVFQCLLESFRIEFHSRPNRDLLSFLEAQWPHLDIPCALRWWTYAILTVVSNDSEMLFCRKFHLLLTLLSWGRIHFSVRSRWFQWLIHHLETSLVAFQSSSWTALLCRNLDQAAVRAVNCFHECCWCHLAMV